MNSDKFIHCLFNFLIQYRICIYLLFSEGGHQIISLTLVTVRKFISPHLFLFFLCFMKAQILS